MNERSRQTAPAAPQGTTLGLSHETAHETAHAYNFGRERSCMGTRRRSGDCMLGHSLLHRHARSGTVTKSKRVDEPPRAGRLHRGFPCTSATKTTHNQV